MPTLLFSWPLAPATCAVLQCCSHPLSRQRRGACCAAARVEGSGRGRAHAAALLCSLTGHPQLVAEANLLRHDVQGAGEERGGLLVLVMVTLGCSYARGQRRVDAGPGGPALLEQGLREQGQLQHLRGIRTHVAGRVSRAPLGGPAGASASTCDSSLMECLRCVRCHLGGLWARFRTSASALAPAAAAPAARRCRCTCCRRRPWLLGRIDTRSATTPKRSPFANSHPTDGHNLTNPCRRPDG